MHCPRCPESELAEALGALHEAVCPTCGGRFLPAQASERVLVQEQGLDPATLRELATLFGGASLACPGCGGRTRPVTIRGVPVDVCFGCGGLWCDAGELARLSGGMHTEVYVDGARPAAPPPPSGRGPPAPALAAPAAPGVIDVPTHSTASSTAGRGSWTGGPSAVFLASSDPPDEGLVWKAIEPLGRYRRPDLSMLCRRACGVLLDGVSREEATAIASSLQAGGVEAIADDVRWLQLPLASVTRRLEVRDEGLVVADTYNQPLGIRWEEISALALGRLQVIRRVAADPVSPAMQLRGGGLKSRAPVSFGQALKELKGATTREETQTLLDVVTAAGTRFRLESGQGQVVLPSGGRQPHEAASIMLERVPAVARTRGVGVPSALEVTRYPDLRTFERELAWALWRKAAAPARPALR